MNSVVAVLFFVASAFAVKVDHKLPVHVHTILDTPGDQYGLYLNNIDTIELSKNDREDAFIGLNTHKPVDDVINDKDLDSFYWHKDLKYAVVKFIKFVDDNGDKKITKDELKNEFETETQVKVAMIECHYLLSKGLKQSCFADQLLTYASLVLDEDDIQSFYEYLGKKDGIAGISTTDAEGIEHKKNKDPKGTAEELGAYHGKAGVTIEEFTDFVTQESVNDDFRRCRDGQPDISTGNVNFKNDCLLEELVEYTNDDLTEIDISVLYRAIDKDGEGGISKAEIKEMPGVKGTKNEADLVTRIVKLLDMSLTTPKGSEEVIDYGEFRTYLRSPTVLLQLERKCTEKVHKQKEEIECLYDQLVKLLTTNHDAIWLVVPDLEQQIAFEIFDTDNDGDIEIGELKFKNKQTKTKFMAEMDHDGSEYVCLEEWNEYMDIPHMVYGVGDCLLKKREDDGRGKCYPLEVEDIIDNIRHFKKEFFNNWFSWYDKNKDGVITEGDDNKLADKCGELEMLFLGELGMGDHTVTEFEFNWYVKQQELADRYDAIVDKGNKGNTGEFHKALMDYIENDITEYDIQVFFDELDNDDNHEIDKKDFDEETWKKVQDMITKIDGITPHGDDDDTANFREFWLWLNSEKVPGATPKVLVKDYFETKCTRTKTGKNQQKEEIECYVEHFKKHSKEIYN